MGEHHDEREIVSLLKQILGKLNWASVLKIFQIKGRQAMPTNFSVQAGTSGTFQVVPNGALQSGAPINWTVDDTANVTLSASPDGDPTKIVATVAAADPNAQFTLSVAATSSNGSALTDSQVVQVTPVAPPAPATSLTIVQLS